MKNKQFVSLILLSPCLLASCHGPTVSVDDALKIIANIESSYEDKNPLDTFTIVGKINEPSLKSESKIFFSKSNKFYYEYNLINGNFSEKWTYVKTNDKEQTYIYTVDRIVDAEISTERAPRYNYTAEAYDEAKWEEIAQSYIDDLKVATLTELDNIKGFLESTETNKSKLTLESIGSTNLYAKYGVDESSTTVWREYDFSNSLLVYYTLRSDDGIFNRVYNISHGDAEIVYPRISE